MNAFSLRRSGAAALLLLCAGLTPTRAAWHATVGTEANSGVAVEISSPFEHTPPDGFLPLWVTIHNASGAARTWNILCNGSGGLIAGASQEISTVSLRVENGQTARVPVLMALSPSSLTFYYQTRSVRIDGYAVADVQTPVPGVNATAKGNPTHVVGMSEALATPIWTSLTKWYTDDGEDLMGTPVDLGQLPGDWRALVGLDFLWMTDADYNALDAARRVAIQDWVSHGGRLYVCAQTDDPSLRASLGLSGTADAVDIGLGRVQTLPWDGKPLPLATVSERTDKPRSERTDPAFTGAEWPIAGEIGRIPLNAPFLITFIVLFAVVVGPVNLFGLAGASRRHRLFWTTPLISVGASLLLAGFIVLQDGFGGSGERVMFCLLLPAEKKAVVLQEQVARTGVLSSRQFTMTEDVVLTPLDIGNNGGTRSHEQAGRNYTGDWFASRSVQAQRAEAVIPSRAEIQLLNADAARDGAPPVVASSVPASIREIRYLDPSGKRWRGGELRTGEKLTLQPDVAAPPPSSGGSAFLNASVNQVAERPGYFVASAGNGLFFETLPSIRWNKQRAIFAGPVSIAR